MELREEVDRLIAGIKDDRERMRLRMQEAAERDAAAQAEADRWRREVRGGAMLARETAPPVGPGGLDERLDRFERTLTALAVDVGQLKQDVGQLKQDVRQLRQHVDERMATKVELEGLRHSIAMMADGYSETNRRLSDVADLLKRNVIAP
jgi:predicted RNase H-like nuclease (RuvC/YqgF family)